MHRLCRIELHNFRCHSLLDLPLSGAPWVVLSGENGAGKTSILEAIFAACRGRSFRTVTVADVVGPTATETHIRLGIEGQPHSLNAILRRDGKKILSLNGTDGSGLAEIAAILPVDYLDGEIYRLISGTPGERRQFIDWALFHVEPEFLQVWRSWRRVNRQRNRLLRDARSPNVLKPWTSAVVRWGEALSHLRGEFLKQLDRGFRKDFAMGAESQDVMLDFCPGWRDESLAVSLEKSAGRERFAGRAVVGPQYDDWRLTVAGRPAGLLSRGQAKLAGLTLVRARAGLLREAGRSGLLLVDDFTADLDWGGSGRLANCSRVPMTKFGFRRCGRMRKLHCLAKWRGFTWNLAEHSRLPFRSHATAKQSRIMCVPIR